MVPAQLTASHCLLDETFCLGRFLLLLRLIRGTAEAEDRTTQWPRHLVNQYPLLATGCATRTLLVLAPPPSRPDRRGAPPSSPRPPDASVRPLSPHQLLPQALSLQPSVDSGRHPLFPVPPASLQRTHAYAARAPPSGRLSAPPATQSGQRHRISGLEKACWRGGDQVGWQPATHLGSETAKLSRPQHANEKSVVVDGHGGSALPVQLRLGSLGLGRLRTVPAVRRRACHRP